MCDGLDYCYCKGGRLDEDGYWSGGDHLDWTHWPFTVPPQRYGKLVSEATQGKQIETTSRPHPTPVRYGGSR